MVPAAGYLGDGITSGNPIWRLLHAPGIVLNGSERVVFVADPLVPWSCCDDALGYALGTVYTWSAERRSRLLVRLGVALGLAFVIVRALSTSTPIQRQ